MGHIKLIAVATILVLIYSPDIVQSLDEESAKEQKCFPITKTVPVDMKWIASLKALYYPFMSRLDVYRSAHDISKKDFKDISEAELYYDSCMEFSLDSSDGSFIGTGFNGKKSKFFIKLYDAGMEKMDFYSNVDRSKGFSGTCYNVMTDNETFIVSACCGSDNEMHWGATSSLKSLPKETIQKIRDYMKSIGFKEEYFTETRYNTCPDSQDDVNVSDKSEL